MSWSTEYDYYCPECTPPSCPNSSASGPANGDFHCLVEDPEGGSYTLCAANTSKDETVFELQVKHPFRGLPENCTSNMLDSQIQRTAYSG